MSWLCGGGPCLSDEATDAPREAPEAPEPSGSPGLRDLFEGEPSGSVESGSVDLSEPSSPRRQKLHKHHSERPKLHKRMSSRKHVPKKGSTAGPTKKKDKRRTPSPRDGKALWETVRKSATGHATETPEGADAGEGAPRGGAGWETVRKSISDGVLQGGKVRTEKLLNVVTTAVREGEAQRILRNENHPDEPLPVPKGVGWTVLKELVPVAGTASKKSRPSGVRGGPPFFGGTLEQPVVS